MSNQKQTISAKVFYEKLKSRTAWEVWFHLVSIHLDHAEELERLRAYVELQPCFCGGWIKLCSRWEALGKDKS